MKTDEFYKSLGEDLSLLSHLTVDDFVLENYQSHPKIISHYQINFIYLNKQKELWQNV